VGIDSLLERFVFYVPLLLSLTVHEWAHAWTACRLGDDTAKLLGRVSLNPIDHIDPVGTVLLPLIGVPFGWAKPVPFNPTRFRATVHMGFGTMLVAVAGPISNFLLGTLAIVLNSVWSRMALDTTPEYYAIGRQLLELLILINFLLALFNLLPIPPLDGSKIADYLMPRTLSPAWNRFCSFGPAALVAVIVIPMVTGRSIFSTPMEWISTLIRVTAS
jgi:Zn-dependent protease